MVGGFFAGGPMKQIEETFASTLKNRLDLIRINLILLNDKALTILTKYDSEGHQDKSEWKVSGWGGGYGNSLCFNLTTGVFKDFGDDDKGGLGLVSYLSRRWRIDIDSVVGKLIADGFINSKDAYGVSKKTGRHTDYGSLILPAPEESVSVSLKPSQIAYMHGEWAYRDTDNSLLGWVVRFEEPGGVKKTPPYTYWSAGGWKKTDWGGKWPLFGLEQLALKGSKAKILIVEGEKTASYATSLLPGCVVLGFGGVNKVDKLELNFLANLIQDRDIVIWPDNDRVGIKAAKKLSWRLIKEVGCKNVKRILVESLKPLENKEGWDIADWTTESGLNLMSEIENAEDQNSLEAFVKNYIYVGKLKRFFPHTPIKSIPLGYDKESFRDMHSHVIPKLDSELLCDTRLTKLDTITFWPGQDRIVNEEGELRLNTWTPDGFMAELQEINFAEQGVIWDETQAELKTKCFREHLDYIFPDEHARSVFLSYIKFLVENPGEKVLWAPLIQGEEGTGKSYFGNLLRKLLGFSNVSVVHNEQIKGNYTGWMANTTLAIIEELSSGGKIEFTDKLKPLITNDTVQITEKFLPDTEIRNRVNFMMFTNRKDALSLDLSDRRFFVYYSPPHRKAPDYYEALFKEMEDNIWWIYHHLLYTVEYAEGINFKGPAPISDSKKSMIDISLREIDAEIKEMLELESGPFYKDVVTVEEVRSVLMERGFGGYTSQSVGRAMARLNCQVLGRYRKSEGSNERVKLIAVRNMLKWQNANEGIIETEYRKSNSPHSPVAGVKTPASTF
jgi:hypothetical protein